MAASLLKRAAARVGAAGLLGEFTAEEWTVMQFTWPLWARPEQLPPALSQAGRVWLTWLLLAGRGFGKSRTGAEWAREQAKTMPGTHGALVAPTAADARDVMVKALLECTPQWEGLSYEPSKRSLRWANGTTATLYSAEEPDRLRGPQHHWAWADEVAAWQYADEVWDMLQMTMRLGDCPRVVATTTPRPVPLVRRLIDDPATAITRGSTYDNADNLSPSFLAAVKAHYEGTRLGRQELYAELLLDTPGALWKADEINAHRVKNVPTNLKRCVVGIDPSGSSHRKSDEAGIITAGLARCGCQGDGRALHGFVINDSSGVLSPEAWGRAAVAAYRNYKADSILGERNYGGDMVATIIRSIDPSVAFKDIVATRGKAVRAAPIAALYEQGRIHHVGDFPQLEDQMTTYDPLNSSISPGRMDALVWAFTELLGGEFVGNPADIKTEHSSRYSRRDGLA